ncbi:MAG: ATP-dependent helicase [Planctomycetota bacterium]
MRLDLSPLNPEQLAAVTAGDGPLLVLAGAGTGKTRVITYRIAHLMTQGVPGDRILGITFTNRAAREMRERLGRMYPDLDPAPHLSTFHSLGLMILREEHARIGFRRRFPIYDDGDSRALLTEVLREIGGAGIAETRLEDVRRSISRWKSRFVDPVGAEADAEEAGEEAEFIAARAYASYESRLNGLNAVDFDDLIYRPVRLLREDPEAKLTWNRRFEHVLVDEYQDTNTAQYHFARLLAGDRENLCVVGDDDQSIYAFRGAEVEKILSFQRDFPRARVVTLERNYRSVGTILEAANGVIANNPHRHAKRLRPERGRGEPIPFLTFEDEVAEAAEVVSRIRRTKQRGVPYAEQAILLRSAIQARPFEEKLRFFEIPYTIIGGRSFFDRREVRDALAYLRLLVHPEDDIAALRILNTPRRGWGEGSRKKLDDWCRAHEVPILEGLAQLERIPGIGGKAAEGAQHLLRALAGARLTLERSAPAAARQLLEGVSYDMAIRELAGGDLKELEGRRRGLEMLHDSLERHEERKGAGRLDEFITNLSLDRTQESDESEEDVLTLLTFHGAKGLEFSSVHLVGIEEDLIPHRRAIAEEGEKGLEEERRLFYVAITRARDHLVMTRCARRRRFGKEFEALESRFAVEIDDALLSRREIIEAEQETVSKEEAAGFLARIRKAIEE